MGILDMGTLHEGGRFSYAVQSRWIIKERAIRCPEISSTVLSRKSLFMAVVQFADDNSFTYCHLGESYLHFKSSISCFAVKEKGKDCFSTGIFLSTPPAITPPPPTPHP